LHFLKNDSLPSHHRTFKSRQNGKKDNRKIALTSVPDCLNPVLPFTKKSPLLASLLSRKFQNLGKSHGSTMILVGLTDASSLLPNRESILMVDLHFIEHARRSIDVCCSQTKDPGVRGAFDLNPR